MIYLAWIISLIALFFVGHYYREIKERLKIIEKQLRMNQKAEVGATNPYHVVDENKVYNSTKKTGGVMPKSPQLLEYEEQQEIMKMNQTSL